MAITTHSNPAASLLVRILYLPDRWLQRVDLSVALLATAMVMRSLMFPADSSAEILWVGTAIIGWVLWSTNGTAHILNKFRSWIPNMLLWMLLRFGR